MFLRTILTRFLKLRVITFGGYLLCLVAGLKLFLFHGTYNYKYVAKEEIPNELYRKVNPDLELNKKTDCTYDDFLQSTKFLQTWEVPRVFDDFSMKGLVNGSYSPEECNPLFSVAVLVTYRNRQGQLDVFLPYMHNFLRKQKIHYKIYLIEQQDEKPWNKGMLYNIGAKLAISEKFSCLILHDIDLLPLDESNLYVCTKQPRHMSASIDKFRFVLIYDTLVGGVLALLSDHYLLVNGFSNKYTGWGGEDDDFYERLNLFNFNITRFPQDMSRYTMLIHHQSAVNGHREQIVRGNSISEGYSSVHYNYIQVKKRELFTLVAVKL